MWEFRTSSGVIGVPVSFEVDGKQYIAVQSGWGVDSARMQARLNLVRRQVPGSAARRRDLGVRGRNSRPRLAAPSIRSIYENSRIRGLRRRGLDAGGFDAGSFDAGGFDAEAAFAIACTPIMVATGAGAKRSIANFRVRP